MKPGWQLRERPRRTRCPMTLSRQVTAPAWIAAPLTGKARRREAQTWALSTLSRPRSRPAKSKRWRFQGLHLPCPKSTRCNHPRARSDPGMPSHSSRTPSHRWPSRSNTPHFLRLHGNPSARTSGRPPPRHPSHLQPLLEPHPHELPSAPWPDGGTTPAPASCSPIVRRRQAKGPHPSPVQRPTQLKTHDAEVRQTGPQLAATSMQSEEGQRKAMPKPPTPSFPFQLQKHPTPAENGPGPLPARRCHLRCDRHRCRRGKQSVSSNSQLQGGKPPLLQLGDASKSLILGNESLRLADNEKLQLSCCRNCLRKVPPFLPAAPGYSGGEYRTKMFDSARCGPLDSNSRKVQ
mmetsp:Transcript_47525/g.152678  ORF Transcript_47525/g.152678 Transcript_47525/m.152678 type:complete len:348 (-) Transcript_47525:27-1070(-)